MPTSHGPGSASSLSNKTIEEREAEYERARAKIFQSEVINRFASKECVFVCMCLAIYAC